MLLRLSLKNDLLLTYLKPPFHFSFRIFCLILLVHHNHFRVFVIQWILTILSRPIHGLIFPSICSPTSATASNVAWIVYVFAPSVPFGALLPLPKRRLLPPSPLLYLPPSPNPYISSQNPNSFFELTVQTVYFLQPLKKITNSWNTSKCWLIRIEELDDQVDMVRFFDTFTGIRIPNPFIYTLPQKLNLLDYRVTEVTKMYGARFLSSREIDSTYIGALAVCFESDDDFAIMAVHTSGQLLFWKEGQDFQWISVDYEMEGPPDYVSVVYRNGKFYAASLSGLTISIDLLLNITQVAPAVPNSGLNKNGDGGHMVYLVNSIDDLFLLYKSVDPDFQEKCGLLNEDGDIPADFQVYKLNEEMSEWVPVTSLGDRVIFIGRYGNFIVSAKEFPGCKKNCIYFHYPFLNDFPPIYPGIHAALFDIEERSANMLSNVYGYSGLLWPPPSWIMTAASSSSGL